MYLLRESCTDTYCLVELEGGWANNPFWRGLQAGPDETVSTYTGYSIPSAGPSTVDHTCAAQSVRFSAKAYSLHSPRSVAPPQAPPLLDLGAQPLERDLQRVTSRIG